MRLSLLLLLNAILMSSCDFGQSDIAQDVPVVQAALPPIIQMVPDSQTQPKKENGPIWKERLPIS